MVAMRMTPARLPHARRPHTAAGLVPVAALAWLAGCDFITGPDTAKITVQAVHHATPDRLGNIPNLGNSGEARRFDSDEGWSITLGEGFATIASVVLEDCYGQFAEIELQNGVIAEDFNAADLTPQLIGTLEVGKVDICAVTVRYAPFDDSLSEVKPRSANIEGNTVYLSGLATKSGVEAPFEIRAAATLEVRRELKNAEGLPLRVSGNESFPIELHLSKTYDRFFDGIDFNAAGGADLAQQALAVLELETRIGTSR